MRLRSISVFVLVILVGAAAFSPLSAGEVQQEPPFTPRTSVQGVPFVGITPDGDRFVGTFALESFSTEGDELRAIGELHGTLATPEGGWWHTRILTVAVPLKILLATRESLRLEFEPFLVPDGV